MPGRDSSSDLLAVLMLKGDGLVLERLFADAIDSNAAGTSVSLTSICQKCKAAGKRVTRAPQVDPRGLCQNALPEHLTVFISCASHEHVACVGEDMIQLSPPCIRCCSGGSPPGAFTKLPPSRAASFSLSSLSHHATLCPRAVFHVLLRDRTGLFCFFQRNSPFTHELLCLRSCHRWYHFSIVFLVGNALWILSFSLFLLFSY